MSMCKTESLCWVLHNVANQLCVNKKGEKNKVVPLWTCKINREEKCGNTKNVKHIGKQTLKYSWWEYNFV